MGKNALSRETFLKGTAVAAGAAVTGFPAFIPRLGEAADQIKIGGIDPLTGTYAALGKSEFNGMTMALEAWNKRGGAMGREAVLIQEDSQADPGVGVQKARTLVNQDKCVALMGSVSSAVSLSVGGAANSLNTIFIDTGGHTDDFTMKNCHWSSFQICHPTWMLTHATGYTFAKISKKWYAISPDYAYGHSIMQGYEAIAKEVGATLVGNIFAPLGTSDWGAYLPQLANSGAGLFIANPGGNDLVTLLRQADSYGIFKKMKMGGPLADLEVYWASPPSARLGIWGVEWYYSSPLVLGNKKSAHEFVSNYTKRFGNPPTPRSAFGYLGMYSLLNGINEAKTTDSVKVARSMEGKKFDPQIFTGEAYFRKENHAMMWPMWVGDCEAQGIGGDKYNLFKITDRVAADKIAPSAADVAKACNLNYPSS
jgi:branched-chain amino acid transport system substrate-binding protein